MAALNCFLADGTVTLDMTNEAYLTDFSGLEQIYVNKYRGDKQSTTTINNNYIIIDYDINQHITYMPSSADHTDDSWGLDSVNLSFGDNVLYTTAVLDLPLYEKQNTYLSKIPVIRWDPSINLSNSYSSLHIEVLGDITTTELGMFDVSHIHYFIRNTGLDSTNIYTDKKFYNVSHTEVLRDDLRNFQILGYKKIDGSDNENTIKLYLTEKGISLDDVNTYENEPDSLVFVLNLLQDQATLETTFIGIDRLNSWYQQEVNELKNTVQANKTLSSVGLTLNEIPYDASSNLSGYARGKLIMDDILKRNTWNRSGDVSNNIDMSKVFDEGEYLVCDTTVAYVPTLTEHSNAGITELALQNSEDTNMVHIILRQYSGPQVIG